ncbi:MAG: hypothetical protein ISP45_07065 [Reyranella sp.]|jgi:hypothetical protein|nr:hypothetical protein [Reyranella sp.]
MHRYCTYFDHRFLDRGLAMIRSLRRVEPGCRISVLCLTPSCASVLERLSEPGVTLMSLADFERDNPDVLAIKDTRCTRDYYFTLGSCLVASILRVSDPADIVTYLDADLLFYSSPAPIYEAMANASVGLIGHRFHWWAKRLEKYGRFNVGWVSFRCDAVGREAASWWRNSCIEWCYGCIDGDRFADQKYLEHIYVKFPNVIEVTHPGTNVGPWNVCRHSIEQGPQDTFVVDGKFPLIFFHYSGLREKEPNLYLCSNLSYLGPFSRTVRAGIYEPYIRLLERIRSELGELPPDPSPVWEDSPPTRRRVLAPAIRIAHRWAGHYVGTGQSR